MASVKVERNADGSLPATKTLVSGRQPTTPSRRSTLPGVELAAPFDAEPEPFDWAQPASPPPDRAPLVNYGDGTLIAGDGVEQDGRRSTGRVRLRRQTLSDAPTPPPPTFEDPPTKLPSATAPVKVPVPAGRGLTRAPSFTGQTPNGKPAQTSPRSAKMRSILSDDAGGANGPPSAKRDLSRLLDDSAGSGGGGGGGRLDGDGGRGLEGRRIPHSMSDTDLLAEGGEHEALIKREFSLLRYLAEEISASYEPDVDFDVGRGNVFNFVRVPFYFEKLVMYGFLLCLDSFLFLFTFLPIRIVLAVFRLLRSYVFRGAPPVTSAQTWDLLRGVIVVLCFCLIIYADASRTYHYIRGQSIIKLYVIFNVLEIFEKLCCSFGQDILDSLFWKAVDKGTATGASSDDQPQQQASGKSLHLHPLSLFVVALVYTLIHSLVLFAQVVTLNVAINSHNNALLTLLVSNQFMELKSSVFRKFEKENLFQISCSDMVERFQLVVFLGLISLQNFSDLGWDLGHAWVTRMAVSAVTVWLSETMVDWIKHAFITKFNHIAPDVYHTFHHYLEVDIVNSSRQRERPESFMVDAYTIPRRIGFVPLPLGCVVLKMLHQVTPWFNAIGAAVFVVVYFLLCVVKMLLRAYLVRQAVKHYNISHLQGKKTPSKAVPERFTLKQARVP